MTEQTKGKPSAVTPLTVYCPTCDALPGNPCWSTRGAGWSMTTYHKTRYQEAKNRAKYPGSTLTYYSDDGKLV